MGPKLHMHAKMVKYTEIHKRNYSINQSGHPCTCSHTHLKDICEQYRPHMHMQVCGSHTIAEAHRDTHACGNRSRISEAMQIPRCAGRQGEDEEERIGRSGVPGRKGGGL